MGGHSHRATIKRHKSAVDAKRGKIFTRIIRELTIAARSGGDPDGNPRLRLAIAKTKEANMPGDTMKNSRWKATALVERRCCWKSPPTIGIVRWRRSVAS